MKPIRPQSGFSLIELMIAVTLGLIILAALTTFFVQTSENRREMDRNTRQIENGRYAIDLLREDLSLAGFYADTAPLIQPTSWVMNDVCPATLANFGFNADPYTAPVPLYGYQGGAGAPFLCLQNLILNQDIVAVRRFGTESLTPAQALLKNDRWYLQNTRCAAQIEATPAEHFVLAATGGGPFPKLEVSCVNTDFAPVWRLREQVYYLRNCSVCVPAPDGIPTLWRAELDPTGPANTMQHYAMVEGIEQMRIDYGVDNTGDGRPDVWTRLPATAGEWANVTSVKVYILSRNLEQSPNWVDNKTYNLGLSGDTAPTNDKYKRHVYSAVVSLPNRSGPREPQLIAAP
jgi:type IV pilus assembly protein PilW